jgi:hypothetical protein
MAKFITIIGLLFMMTLFGYQNKMSHEKTATFQVGGMVIRGGIL